MTINLSLAILAPPPKQTVSEWADAERRLSPEASAEPGKWSTDRAPYQRAIMDAWHDIDAHTIVFMKSAQVGATEILNNILGYSIDRIPGPMLVLQPTLDMGKAWSKDRLATMLRDTPCLHGKVRERRSKDSDNTILHKVFPGGHLTVAGANSAASLASRPIRDVLADEVDRYPPSAGAEGDPLALAFKRSTTFWNRKRLVTSTPTVKGESRIEAAFAESDQQHYWVPCPHCEEYQRLYWANVKWPDGDPDGAHYECAHCGGAIHDEDKPAMLDAGEWRPEAAFGGIRGFHINEIYSPWVRFGEMASNFLEAKKLPETLKTWINTALGEVWEEQGDKLDAGPLIDRQEGYDIPPEGVQLLTAGVDVQDDRLEATVMGWGLDFESWVLGHEVWWGDPGRRDLWGYLEEWLQGEWRGEEGVTHRVTAMALDTGGHFTENAYQFIKRHRVRRWFATKGVGGPGRPLVGRPSRANKARIPLFPVGTDTAKELLFARLRILEPGPGYIHFGAGLDEEFFHQLVAEKRVEKKSRGQTRYEWRKIRARNEALDLTVLNMVALEILNPNLKSLAERRAEEAEPEAPPPKKDPVQEFRRRVKAPHKRRSGFIHGWR